MRTLVEMAGELEQVLGYDSLDIEFAMTAENKLYILQVRPIAAHKKTRRVHDDDFLKEISEIKNFVTQKFNPRPLALSLYQYLITDLTWGKARAMIGYKDTFPEPLLISISGRPYIDTDPVSTPFCRITCQTIFAKNWSITTPGVFGNGQSFTIR